MSIVRVRLVSAFVSLTLFSAYLAASSSKATPQSQVNQQSAIATPKTDAAQSTPSLELPVTFERQVGDLDGMAKRHQIRVLVVPSRSGFFYDKGHPQGIFFEAFDEFQRFVNQEVKTGSLKVTVRYIPVRPEQMERLPRLEHRPIRPSDGDHHCNPAYSDLEAMRIGISRSALFKSFLSRFSRALRL
jgi:hypothetical protein